MQFCHNISRVSLVSFLVMTTISNLKGGLLDIILMVIMTLRTVCTLVSHSLLGISHITYALVRSSY